MRTILFVRSVHVPVVQPERKELRTLQFHELGPGVAAVDELVDIEPAALPLVVEVQLRDGPGVEHGHILNLLRPVDMVEARQVVARLPQDLRVHHGLGLGEERRLAGFHVAALDGEVPHQDFGYLLPVGQRAQALCGILQRQRVHDPRRGHGLGFGLGGRDVHHVAIHGPVVPRKGHDVQHLVVPVVIGPAPGLRDYRNRVLREPGY